MGRVPGLTLERRQQALGMLVSGMPVNDGCTTLQGRSFAKGLCATDCERQDYVPTDPTLGCRCHNATARKGSTGRYIISNGRRCMAVIARAGGNNRY
ncbi:hypothetical protein DPMN_168022 [Dreissena polymorpha]|uniref:Uncharacterized protein n=1 Tax=Dreissena polymorpha TaxID=45954 RepID=A0A9D4F197_DREPO|nr:hypothetical protein DPMN_168022 [Dreissena polymorpha]